MPHEETLKQLEERRAFALAMGGEKRLERHRSNGNLDARARLAHLFDDGAMVESGMHARSARAEVRDKSPADGKVAGFGKVDGRWVAAMSNDFTVMGASSALINGKKMRHLKHVANTQGMPLIWMGESTGARMPDRMGASGRAILGSDPAEYRRLRETPWVAVQLGDSYGSLTWYGCMSDFVVMKKGAAMAVASPRVTSLAINQPIDKEDLGGWRMHTRVSGLVDYATDTDEEAIDLVKKFLSYLPSHSDEAPPVHEIPQGSGADMESILDIVPVERQKVYDVRKVIAAIADKDSLFELKPNYGKTATTAFTRIAGRSVGVIANNPMFKGGAIDPDGCNKVTSFMVLCDSFNIPIVMLVDVPGFLIGVDGERIGAPGRIMNWMNALQLVTVPKISIILRKSYGQAYLNMGGGQNSDEVALWPSADLGFMDPRVGVNVVYGITREDDPEEFERRVAELDRDSEPWELAELYEAQEVIDPRETRQYLIDMLEIYRGRMSGGLSQHLLSSWPTSYV